MQFCDLQSQYLAYKDEIHTAIDGVLCTSAFINGPDVHELERELGAFCGASHVVACSNGTDALYLALFALGIGPGDEVIVPDFTFFATAEVVALLGARPVFADIDPQSYLITPDSIQNLISPRTKAIIPVSLYGQIPDLQGIQSLAEAYGIAVIEDGAQSFGAQNALGFSCAQTLIATTSFYPAKPLGGYGDGGALFCAQEDLAQKLRILVNQGQRKTYEHSHIGTNSRLDSLQAAILRVKLRHFPQELERRRQIAQIYSRELSPYYSTPLLAVDAKSSWAQYTLRVPQRDRLRQQLQELGIPTAVHYPIPVHRQEAFASLSLPDTCCPNSALAAQEVLSLPLHPFMSAEEIGQVIDALKRLCPLI